MRLRSSIYWVALIALLLAANLSAQAGWVALNVDVEGTGTCSEGLEVCKGSTVRIIATASDCDQQGDCGCCWDDLTFTWPPELPAPTRQPNGSYRMESIITCDWSGERTFSFSADDQAHCPPAENDFPGTQTVKITPIELINVTGPSDPVVVCPSPAYIDFEATTTGGRGAQFLTWTGGENGTVWPLNGLKYSAVFSAPGVYEVTAKLCGTEVGKSVQVVVQDPICEMTFLGPTGTIGGMTPIRIQVRTTTGCATLHGGESGLLIQAEDPTEPTGWHSFITMHEAGTSSSENGIDTEIYRLLYDWDTTPLKNGPISLRASANFDVGSQMIPVTVTQSVEVRNLSFTSADPEGVVVWKDDGEPKTLTVNMEDNDLTDPMTLTFRFYPTSMDNSHSTPDAYPVVPPIDLPQGLGGSSYTLPLNSETFAAPRGLYTYSVEASQTDINRDDSCATNRDPESRIEDHARYRSEHVNIRRGLDDYDEPIFRVEYVGTDNNGTPWTFDDEYVFLLRRYVMSSTDMIIPSWGNLLLYGPDLALARSWNISDLRCTEHSTVTNEVKDGLEPGRHGLLLKLSPSDIPYGGIYRFVLHVKDAHGDLYRRTGNRWAVDLSYAWDQRSATVYVCADEEIDDTPNGQYAYNMLASIYDPNDQQMEPGYHGRWQLGYPSIGGSGLCSQKPADDMVHTLDRLNSAELRNLPQHPEYSYKPAPSAVWAFFGHSSPDYVEFSSGGLTKEYEEPGDAYSVWYTPGVDYVHLAYLAGCGTAGGKVRVNGWGPWIGGTLYDCPNPADSVAAAFWDEGADSVVGFRDGLWTTNDFVSFNQLFWEGLCRKGLTVYEAVERARLSLPLGAALNYPQWCDLKLGAKTVIWGGEYYLWDHRLQDGY